MGWQQNEQAKELSKELTDRLIREEDVLAAASFHEYLEPTYNQIIEQKYPNANAIDMKLWMKTNTVIQTMLVSDDGSGRCSTAWMVSKWYIGCPEYDGRTYGAIPGTQAYKSSNPWDQGKLFW